MKRISAALLMLSLSGGGIANGIDDEACQRAAETGGEFSRAICSDNRTRLLENKMNTTYASLKSVLKNDAMKLKQVVNAQKAWLKYREKSCEFWSGIYNPQVSLCREAVTSMRSNELTHMYKCYAEGGNEC